MKEKRYTFRGVFRNLVRNTLGFSLKLFGFRIGLINQSAIGHLAFDTEVNHLENIKNQKRKRDIWYLLGNTANQTLTVYWTAKLSASSNPLMLKIYSAIQPLPRFQTLLLNRELGAGDGYILDKYGPTFQFTKFQNVRAEELLGKLGIDFSKPLVLFCLRDDAYYASKGDQHNINIHSHRNVDASEYRDSILFLLSKGFSVMRMGREAEKGIEISHEDFIDLPFATGLDVQAIGLGDREILELALFQRCAFVISTGLGMDALATLFRKRVYLTDYYSVYNLYSSKLFPMFLPKGYFKIEENRMLTPEEVLNSKFLKAKSALEFEAQGVKLVNCSQSQLLQFVVDIFSLETHQQQPNISKLVTYHSKALSKQDFRGKYVPPLSDYWLNNI